MLRIENLICRFGSVTALDDVSLTITKGEFVGIIGRSGAGKSTLLRLINRLIEPSLGGIHFEDEDVLAKRGRALQDWRRRAAMIFQQFALIERLSVLDNVLVGRVAMIPRWRSWTLAWPVADRALAIEALDRLDMTDHALKRADQLSGGQQQRVTDTIMSTLRDVLDTDADPAQTLDALADTVRAELAR